MKYVLNPSLEHIALVKIVVILWNQNCVRDLMKNLYFLQKIKWYSEEWQQIENRVIQKVPQLSLPHLLKEKVLGFIRPIGIQILLWMLYHCTSSYLRVNLPARLCWTSQGRVDEKKTAKLLVKDKKLDVSKHYKLACIYCLEEDIKELYVKVPENLKQSFFSENSLRQFDYKLSPIGDYMQNQVFLWTYYMKNEGRSNVHYPHQSAFKDSAIAGKKAATEYFLRKLTPWEREESLVSVAKLVRNAGVLCFLLSEMNEGQQNEVFKTDPYRILMLFLDWPFQSFFIETANHMWDVLSVYDFDLLLKLIIIKQKEDYKDWDYQKLFEEFWKKSPVAFKTYIINLIYDNMCMIHLFTIKDKENSRLLLKDTTAIEKKKLIFCDSVQNVCQYLLHRCKWDLLEFFIQECLSSRDEMLTFKMEFEKRTMRSNVKGLLLKNKHRWDQLFPLSDGSISKIDERGESSSSKRFCDIQ